VKILVDTHILLRALTAPDRLTDRQREVLQDPTQTVYASAVNIVEIAIKSSIGKLTVADTLERDRYTGLLAAIEESGFEMLAFTAVHAAGIRTLPFHHRDPFDRMIIAQALGEDCTVMTVDGHFSAYPVKVM
jgi:PIN domain nuclease of toxin-antitoxin system